MFKQGWDFVNGIPEPLRSIIRGLIALVATGVLLYKTVKFVPQDKLAIKLKFSKVVYGNDGKPIIKRPGIHIIVPFTHSLEQVDSRERVIRLKTDTHSSFYVSFKDGRAGGVKIPASITVLPIDVCRWRYVSEDVENRVTDIGVTALQGPITSADPEAILNNSAAFSHWLGTAHRHAIDQQLAHYGGQLVSVNVGMADVPDSQPLADALGSKDLRDVHVSVVQRAA